MELIEAKDSKESRPSLYNAALGKLKLWDLTDTQISSIEGRGEPLLYFDVLSPITGTVTMRHVAIGDYVKEGMALFRLIDLTKVWVLFDAYESDLPWIKNGDRVEFTVSALPGRTFSERVSFIDPMIDAKSRVAKVRVELANPGLNLKPEMFANGVLKSDFTESGTEILIPRSSVLWTGKRAIVYIKVPDRENPSFLYREVILGPEAGAYFVVADGLEEGDEIAANGVFKIDAAAQLMGQTSMMNPRGEPLTTAHDHSKMVKDSDNSRKINTAIDPASVPSKFSQQLTLFYRAYLQMKDAFVESDPSKVSTLAAAALSKLEEVDMALLKGETHNEWMILNGELNRNILAISAKYDIEKQRDDFIELNNTLYTVVKSFKLQGETAYYQFCPMANGDKGAYWLSNSQEIRNPYFGDMMLTCGEVKEVIND
jgi:Cu(I)/Ag(I) efflux system membrane fusion protein